jgi:hypothetical protein
MSGICKYFRDEKECPFGETCRNVHDWNIVSVCKHGDACTMGKNCYYGPKGHSMQKKKPIETDDSELINAYRTVNDLCAQLKQICEENLSLKKKQEGIKFLHDNLSEEYFFLKQKHEAMKFFYESHIDDLEQQLVCLEEFAHDQEVQIALDDWAKNTK